MDHLDWRWLKSFIAVAQMEGMQAAARHTGISQPTLSRHITQLEETLGLQLFIRAGRTVTLSTQGVGLYERAQQIQNSVKAFERQAVGLSTEEQGAVRLTMTENFGIYFAHEWLASLRLAHPHITIDLVLDDSELNLLLREAEIAVRMFRPTQLDLKTRLCGSLNMGFYASSGYIDMHGRPEHLDNLRDHQLIGYDRLTDWIDAANQMGYTFKRDDFVFRTDSMVMQQRAAETGVGIVVLPEQLAEQSTLQRVLPDVSMPGHPIYLTAAPDLHKNPRMLKVWQHLESALTTLLSAD